MPGQRRGRRGCAIALAIPHPDREARTAPQTHRSSEAAPGRGTLAFAFRKTVEVTQIEINTVGIALSFSRVFCLTFAKSFADEKPASAET